MADKITLRLVMPSRVLLDEEVDDVTAPGALGEFGVLPNHIAFLTLLEIGALSYRQGVERHRLVVDGGYAEVLDNVMTVLADAAERAGEVDVEGARRAKEGAEKRLAEIGPEDEDYGAIQNQLRRAQARLDVAGQEATSRH